MNLDLLMDIEPAVAEGVRGWLTDQAIACYTRRNAPESFQSIRPRIEAICKVGAASGHRSVIGGVLYHDTWHFNLALRVIVEPQNVEAANLMHDQLISRVRGMMKTFGQATWVDTVNFPYHLIVEPLMDNTSDNSMQTVEDEEFCILTFSGIVQIRTDAWNNT
jgi:hypothetical protein